MFIDRLNKAKIYNNAIPIFGIIRLTLRDQIPKTGKMILIVQLGNP
jgi:hypothetical protein